MKHLLTEPYPDGGGLYKDEYGKDQLQVNHNEAYKEFRETVEYVRDKWDKREF